VATAVHAAPFGPVQPLGGEQFADPRVAAAPSPAGALVAMTNIEDCGDIGCFGAPVALRLGPAGPPAPFRVPAALSRSRVLVLWGGERSFGAALAGPDGRFRATAAPPGPAPDAFHTNPTNRAIATAGSYALVGWSVGSRVRVSLRRF
jgi:hypothetical protein